MTDSNITSGGLTAPRHLAIIMDGNGRWAQARGKQRVSGHKEGANAVRRVISECVRLGVKELTLFAFSSENWKRPALEVNALMALFVEAIRKESKNLLKNGIKTRIVGDKSKFPSILQSQIAKGEIQRRPIDRDNRTPACSASIDNAHLRFIIAVGIGIMAKGDAAGPNDGSEQHH